MHILSQIILTTTVPPGIHFRKNGGTIGAQLLQENIIILPLNNPFNCFHLANPHNCACEKHVPIYLRLRGLCEETNIDTYWMPQSENGQYFLLGVTWSKIQFNETQRGWDLIVKDRQENTTGFAKLNFHSFVLGKSEWSIENDSKTAFVLQMISMFNSVCNEGLPYSLTLKLSGCSEDQFTCDDGQCVDINSRCDQINDCRDESDEHGCQLLVLNNGYNREVPPFTTVETFQ